MSVFFQVQGKRETLQITQTKKPPGNNRAYGYLKRLSSKLERSKGKLETAQAQDILNSVETVRSTCRSKSPKIYRLQAKLNPFSKAYKIEKLARKILTIVPRYNETHISSKKDSAGKNTDDPFNFFAVGLNSLDYLKKTNCDDIFKIFYSEYHNRLVTDVRDLSSHRHEAVVILVKFDRETNAVRLFTEEEIQALRDDRTQLKENAIYHYDYLESYARILRENPIMDQLRNFF